MDFVKILFVIFFGTYLASRFIVMKAMENLPEDKKLALIDASAKGRKSLLYTSIVFALIFLFAQSFISPAIGAFIIGGSLYNYGWFYKKNFPKDFMRRQFIATGLMVLCGLGIIVLWAVGKWIEYRYLS